MNTIELVREFFKAILNRRVEQVDIETGDDILIEGTDKNFVTVLVNGLSYFELDADTVNERLVETMAYEGIETAYIYDVIEAIIRVAND